MDDADVTERIREWAAAFAQGHSRPPAGAVGTSMSVMDADGEEIDITVVAAGDRVVVESVTVVHAGDVDPTGGDDAGIASFAVLVAGLASGRRSGERRGGDGRQAGRRGA